jgi:GNAT superfamily N-acetyltransferase
MGEGVASSNTMTYRSNPALLEHVVKGMSLYWRTLGQARHMEHHTGDIEVVMTRPRGGIERIFNVRLSPVTAVQRVQEIAAEIKAGELPDGLLIDPCATPGNLAHLLVLKGFSIDASGLCMALDLDGWQPPRKSPVEIQVLAVDDRRRLKAWVEIVNIALIGWPILSFDQFHDLYCLESTRFFLALEAGTPAAVCITITGEQAATLEMVATLPFRRNRGLGTAVVATALEDLKDRGLHTVTLRAEPDGINLYRRLGFVEICKRVVATYRGQ